MKGASDKPSLEFSRAGKYVTIERLPWFPVSTQQSKFLLSAEREWHNIGIETRIIIAPVQNKGKQEKFPSDRPA